MYSGEFPENFFSTFNNIFCDLLNLRIQFKYKKIRTRKNSAYGHFSFNFKTTFNSSACNFNKNEHFEVFLKI